MLAVLLFFFYFFHPQHIAYTSININPVQKTIDVTHKLIADDFTLLFYHLFEKNIQPSNDNNFTKNELDLIERYMSRRFIVVNGNDTVKLNFSHKSIDDQHIWMYYCGNINNETSETISINNQLMLDINMDQTNLVIITNGKQEKGLSFNWDNRESMLKWDE